MKFITNLWIIINVVLIIWCGVSYIEILCKHWNQNPDYSDMNIIITVTDWAAEYHNMK